nr:hypothetical protein [uncultured Duganella sp.]
MSTKNQPLVLEQGPSTLARAKFGPGMLLQHDDLEQLNTYTRDLNRLMLSSLFGCGVVCGLVVSAKADRCKVTVTVECGLALDGQGDPIHLPKPQSLVINEQCVPNMPSSLWVVLRGTEKYCAPRTPMCGGDEEESASVCTRERDCFEIRIECARPGCVCGGPEPDPKKQSKDLDENKCKCADPDQPAQKDHYEGKSCCACVNCANCNCDDVLLARLDRSGDGQNSVWTADHGVRRFVRPVLMRDHQAWIEQQERRK